MGADSNFFSRVRGMLLKRQRSVELLLILLVLYLSTYLYCQRLYESVEAHRNQILRAGVAREVADEIRKQLDAGAEAAPVTFYRAGKVITNRYPEADPYLLDSSGKVIHSLSTQGGPEGRSVALQPIEEFLTPEKLAAAPIYSEDPQSPDRQVVFSAAPFSAGAFQGYVFVVLQNRMEWLMTIPWLERGHWRSFYIFFSLSLLVTLLLLALFRRILHMKFRRIETVVEGFTPQDIFVSPQVAAKIGNGGRDSYEDSVMKLVESVAKTRRDLHGHGKEVKKVIERVVHDARTPLFLIQAYAEQLLANDLALPEQKKEAERILRNVRSLLALLADLHELDTIENRPAPLRMENCQLDELLEELILVYESRAKECGLTIRLAVPETIPAVPANTGLLERALRNLLDNSLRHTKPGGTIELKLSRRPDDAVRIQIRDSGCGIPESELPYIFEPFRQVSSENRKNGSSGLGLAIVDSIIKAHGSKIFVESKEYSETVFWFDLSRLPDGAPD